MKQCALVFIIFSIALNAAAQKNTRFTDSVIKKIMLRIVAHPDCDVCDSTGIALLKVCKEKDSMQVKVVYASAAIYVIETDKYIARWLNKKYKELFKNKYKVLMPLYFQYYKENTTAIPLSDSQMKIVKKQIKKQGRNIHTTNAVSIVGYAPMR